jgi:2-oxoglutarate ferredoxin oxidoreductase subunit alpha
MDITIRIAGENGEGVLSVGETMAEALARTGLNVYTFKNLPAEIKGGASMIQVRVSDGQVRSPGDALDILMVWNQQNYNLHLHDLREEGIVLYDPSECEPDQTEPYTQLPIPLNRIIKEEIKVTRSKNVLAFGILTAYIGIPLEIAERMITESRWGRRKEFLTSNLQAIHAGYRYVKEDIARNGIALTLPEKPAERRMILTGNEALSLGALAAGCQYYAGYPITPASDIMETLAKHLPKVGGVVVQTEDEIAALASVIGASFAGKKSMTATSGPGLSLMVEELGLATMYEFPIVVINVQRGGPSTGMPTKVEQSDLDLAVYGHHGDAPRIVVAPCDVEECFYTAIQAFNLAEKYQVPVIVLSDQHIAQRSEVIHRPDPSQITVLHRLTPSPDGTNGKYQRYELTETGISPMATPGVHDSLYVATGLEHNEYAHIDYSPRTHVIMSQKRAQKLEGVTREPGFVRRYGPEDAEFGIIAWGSTAGPVIEAIEQANARGYKVAGCVPKMISPIPDTEIRAFLEPLKDVAVIELNYSGQYANLLQSHFCRPMRRFNKFTGLPFRTKEIFDFIKGVIHAPFGAPR